MGFFSKRRLKTSLVKSARSPIFRFGLLFLISALILLPACTTHDKPLAEAAPAAPAASAPTSDQPQQVTNSLPPPELKAVEDAVKRVFKGAALIDAASTPAFVAGDFNGDLSQDIAVVVKPAPDKLAEMNEEFPTWMLRDPFGPLESKSPRLRIAANDEMLAVIHGYGTNGWRDPEATQTFLLKNAAGSGMETRAAREFLTANRGKKLPQLRGDVLSEKVGGKTGYLYFANATYGWYDPATFKGEDVSRGVFHGARKDGMKR
jgi:hypothetical protein